MKLAFGQEIAAKNQIMKPKDVSDEELKALQQTTIRYYFKEVSSTNGLIRDKTEPGRPASIAAVGMALSSAPAYAERTSTSASGWPRGP